MLFGYIKRKIKGYIIRRMPKETIIKKEPVYIPTVMDSMLENRIALITGGTAGIGFSIARRFLQSGAKVIITGRSEIRLDDAVAKLAEYGDVRGVVMDNGNIAEMSNKFQEITSIFDSPVDIVVNNAGVLAGSCFGKYTEEDYDKVMDVNLKGTFFLSQMVANYMKEQGIKGNILMIGSSSSLRPALSPYTLSKWGIRGLTLGMAKSLAPYGITVNGLAPGPTATAMLVDENKDQLALDSAPLKRYADAEEMANLALFLVGNTGKMIVGDMVFMTGGAGVITFDDIRY